MPQDIPVEASETLAFTPPSLADRDDAPSFMLRAPTRRDRRFQRRLYSELGLTRHAIDAIRAEVLAGLKALWTPEDFEKHSPVITDYWTAKDDFALQAKEDPDLVWEYDTELETRIDSLVSDVARSWAPLGKMLGDNAEFALMTDPIMVAVTVKSFTGLDVERKLDRGYLTVDAAEDIHDALDDMHPEAWAELVMACVARLYLDEEEAKNFVSPSSSGTTPVRSTTTSRKGKRGRSADAASSTKTPETA